MQVALRTNRHFLLAVVISLKLFPNPVFDVSLNLTCAFCLNRIFAEVLDNMHPDLAEIMYTQADNFEKNFKTYACRFFKLDR